jgi:oligoendopeptidase F
MDAAREPELSDAKWLELWHQFMGGVDYAGEEEFLKSRWLRQPHIVTSPFYYIEYGLAQLGAAQVWRNARRDYDGAVAAYRRALALGATRTLPELFAAAGAKFTTDAETLREAVELMEELVR